MYPHLASTTTARSSRHYLDLINSLDAIVWEAVPDRWRFTFVSDGARRMLDIAPSRWIADTDCWLRIVHPDDRDGWTSFQRHCAEPGAPLEYCCRVRDRRGRTRWLNVLVHPVRSPHGTVRRYCGVMLDVTSRVAADAARDQRIAQLRQTQEALRTAVRIRDEVLGVVAHDLRNPVHTILLGTASMLDLPMSEAQRTKHLRIIQRAARDMDRLIGDLLDVSRFSAGSITLTTARVSIGDVLEESVEQLSAEAAAHGLQLQLVRPDAPLYAMADRDRLRQVLSNLLGNAIKFTARGGRVSVCARARAGNVEIEVSDTGRGIAPTHLGHVFDRFWQADRRARFGAGLGLSIAKTIVEAHGGHIAVRSTPGCGSTFVFTLPSGHA